MKKTMIVLLLVLLFVNFMFAGVNMTIVEKVDPKIYQQIRTRSIDEWGDNHMMVVAYMESQCGSFIGVLFGILGDPDLTDEKYEIFVNSAIEWSYEDSRAGTIAYKDDPHFIKHIDANWMMVLAYYNSQVEAMGEYQ